MSESTPSGGVSCRDLPSPGKKAPCAVSAHVGCRKEQTVVSEEQLQKEREYWSERCVCEVRNLEQITSTQIDKLWAATRKEDNQRSKEGGSAMAGSLNAGSKSVAHIPFTGMQGQMGG